MKILVGICGIGNGHINRQTCVIEYLLECRHTVVIATTGNNSDFFKERFPNVKVINISIPWISCNEKGIDFKDSLNKYINSNTDQYKNFFEFGIDVNDAFNGIPDIVITDYEPNVAQYSYAVGIPLICMEQQSKFLYLNEEKIDNFSIIEEIRRIDYFFPKFDFKIISSFFPININDKKVKIVSPIIRNMKQIEKKKNQVLVYFSPYSDSFKYKLILDAISKIKYLNFIVYTKQQFDEFYSNNIIFKSFGEIFINDLQQSIFLISTAGHQLLSEAISINLPLYLIPLDSYEQNYNALMVEKYKIGIIGEKINKNEIETFYNNLNFYSNNINIFKDKYYKIDWKNVLNQIFNIYKKDY